MTAAQQALAADRAEHEARLAADLAALETRESALRAGFAALDAEREALAAGQSELAAARASLDEERTALRARVEQLAEKEEKLDDGLFQLDIARNEPRRPGGPRQAEDRISPASPCSCATPGSRAPSAGPTSPGTSSPASTAWSSTSIRSARSAGSESRWSSSRATRQQGQPADVVDLCLSWSPT